jgi:DNA invertase Pin-like site-specific DNA recombinase
MKIDYARVSTDEQNLALQLDALKGAGCDTVYEDRLSRAVAQRPGLEQALAACADRVEARPAEMLGNSEHLV